MKKTKMYEKITKIEQRIIKSINEVDDMIRANISKELESYPQKYRESVKNVHIRALNKIMESLIKTKVTLRARDFLIKEKK